MWDIDAQFGSQFLKLEDWRKLGLNLDTELKGVVSAAALEEGNRLYENGEATDVLPGRLIRPACN